MAAMIERYGIYWVRLDPAEGREVQKSRPCVVVSPNRMHAGGMAVVCPLTTKLHADWAHRIQLVCDGVLSEVMPDHIRAVSTTRFGRKIAMLDAADSESLRLVLTRLYGSA